MKKLNIFIKILEVLLIFLGVYLIWIYLSPEEQKVENNNVIKQEEIVQLSFSSSTKSIIKDFYNVKVDFPVTNNEKINFEINKEVEKMVSDFEKDAIDFGPLPSDIERPYTLFVNFESHLGNKYDTFVFLISLDFGGAHPNHFYKTLTFDKDSNILSIEDFLKREFPDKDILNKISELAQNKITENMGENANIEMIKDGAGPDMNNFRNFYIDEQEIVFLFEPYAVAPYAYSSQQARIKLSEIF